MNDNYINANNKKNQKLNYVDVICQHNKNGKIIPIKVRVIDEDGEIQTYLIKDYKDLTHYSNTTNDKEEYVKATSHIRNYQCHIQVFDRLKTIELFYNSNEQRWRITP